MVSHMIVQISFGNQKGCKHNYELILTARLAMFNRRQALIG